MDGGLRMAEVGETFPRHPQSAIHHSFLFANPDHQHFQLSFSGDELKSEIADCRQQDGRASGVLDLKSKMSA